MSKKHKYYLFSNSLGYYCNYSHVSHQLSTTQNKLNAAKFLFRRNAVIIRNILLHKSDLYNFKIVKL